MSKGGALIVIYIFTPFHWMWEGLVLKVLWNWFIPTLFGGPQMTIPYALGISLIVGLMTHHPKDPGDENMADMVIWTLSYWATAPAMALLFGVIFKAFI